MRGLLPGAQCASRRCKPLMSTCLTYLHHWVDRAGVSGLEARVTSSTHNLGMSAVCSNPRAMLCASECRRRRQDVGQCVTGDMPRCSPHAAAAVYLRTHTDIQITEARSRFVHLPRYDSPGGAGLLSPDGEQLSRTWQRWVIPPWHGWHVSLVEVTDWM